MLKKMLEQATAKMLQNALKDMESWVEPSCFGDPLGGAADALESQLQMPRLKFATPHSKLRTSRFKQGIVDRR